MGIIDYRDSRPIFEQISDHYKQLILMGVLEPGEKMPSVRALSVEIATNPNTIQKAYAELEREGFCYSVAGKGSFVTEDIDRLLGKKKDELIGKMRSLRGEAGHLGMDADKLWQESGKGGHND
ncbi:MAG: GntR family transcriptional regulator [Lachnospiraceae bacterium]|nr:GntR family transcriptional regulator [Lachnospiraceae bacterium]